MKRSNPPDTALCAYAAYGLTIHASLELPALELADDEVPADIWIHRGSTGRPLPEDPSSRGCYRAAPNEALVYYPEVGQMLIRGGREILIDPVEGAEDRLIQHVLMGVGLGILLHQRGHLTLHASAVGIDGGVAGFIGWKRMGKSTTAAALYARGHRMISDDTIVLDKEEVAMVLPGTRQMRLNPDSLAASLGMDPETIPRLQKKADKRVGEIDDFDPTPLPLRHVYVLDWGEDIYIERMKAKEAFIQLLTHSYAQRFLKEVGATKRYFRQVEALIRQVPVYRLEKPVDFERLPELVEHIEEHMAEKKTAVSA